MKDIGIFCLPADSNSVSVVDGNKEYYNYTSIKPKLQELGVSHDFIECNVEELPSLLDYRLVVIIDKSIYFSDDFFFNAINLSNLYQDAGVFFSPTKAFNSTSSDNQYLVDEYYHKYDIDLSNSIVSDITKEPHNFGSIIGSPISGRAYNESSFHRTITPRGESVENSLFLARVASRYKIYHAKNLTKIKRLSDLDYSSESISSYYYNIGFQEGLRMSSLSGSDRSYAFKRKFIEAPELLDHKQPKWLFEEYDDRSSPSIETLVMLKCKFSVGFFEGLTGKKLL